METIQIDYCTLKNSINLEYVTEPKNMKTFPTRQQQNLSCFMTKPTILALFSENSDQPMHTPR